MLFSLSVLLLIWPQPRQVEQKADVLLKMPMSIEAPAALQKPAALLQRELERLLGPDVVTTNGKTSIKLNLTPEDLPKPEEYTLDVSEGEILLRAHDEQGAFWGLRL